MEQVERVLSWLVEDTKHRFDQQGNPGNYSPKLKEAIELLENVREVQDNYLFIDLNVIPYFRDGIMTKDDVAKVVADALRLKR